MTRCIGILTSARVMLFTGILTPIGVFNTATFDGNPISMLWLAGIIAILGASPRLSSFHLPYLVLAFVMVLKILVGGSIGVSVKFIVGVIFLVLLSKTDYADGLYFINGIWISLPISIAYAVYQWVVLILIGSSDGTGAVIPVEIWNSKGWHALLVDAANIPRAPAFMFEPAYFAMIINIALAGELLFSRNAMRPRLVVLAVFGLILSNSRTGIVAGVLIFMCAVLIRFRRIGLLRVLVMLSVVGPLLPVPFLHEQILNYSENRDVIDISVFARYISFAAFVELDLFSMLFGVRDYQQIFQENSIFVAFADVLADQGSDMDPKSFLATNLFHFGIVGASLFYVSQIYLAWNSMRGLALFASINILFFNVYAYSWPPYWVMISLVFVVIFNGRRYGEVGGGLYGGREFSMKNT